MQSGKKFGMQTMNDALYQLYMARDVSEEECLRVSSDPNEFMRLIGKSPVEGDTGTKEVPQSRQGTQPGGGLRR
jgi:twitching motility protein PilT